MIFCGWWVLHCQKPPIILVKGKEKNYFISYYTTVLYKILGKISYHTTTTKVKLLPI